ncbi:hypothetical protein CROQUDRAFT_674096 [Cronartium quercuum f. sp. fusiforme G11]|uniref:Uncharacterized protein n=1 Tax=Cronartium quercuum f. sp. fusiforme G11 TaxID=708437 RepID=A0A9P6ND06_9BASI|nr:hypothetical protein CROQUDRAFT_674096 [Cronartium quercuum f. sp. fusiforme G11]
MGENSTTVTAAELQQKLSAFQLDEILSCTKVEPASSLARFTDVELDDLDGQIEMKLAELKKLSLFSQSQGTTQSNWLLRQECAPETDTTVKRRWLVARNIENDVELSIDLDELDHK